MFSFSVCFDRPSGSGGEVADGLIVANWFHSAAQDGGARRRIIFPLGSVTTSALPNRAAFYRGVEW